MKVIVRRKGSQRTRVPKEYKFLPNFAGQGGVDYITLEGTSDYIMLVPETTEEIHQLMSEAHIAYHNYKETT